MNASPGSKTPAQKVPEWVFLMSGSGFLVFLVISAKDCLQSSWLLTPHALLNNAAVASGGVMVLLKCLMRFASVPIYRRRAFNTAILLCICQLVAFTYALWTIAHLLVLFQSHRPTEWSPAFPALAGMYVCANAFTALLRRARAM